MAKDYHIKWIPTMYLVDTEGRVILATVEIEKLKAKLKELQRTKQLVAPELAGQDRLPQYPGGTTVLLKKLATITNYPVEAEHCGVKGTVTVSFFVEKDGTVSDVRAAKTVFTNRLSDKKFSKYSEIDKYAMREKAEGLLKDEAVRVVKTLSGWEPAMRRGELVRVLYTVPITFKLR